MAGHGGGAWKVAYGQLRHGDDGVLHGHVDLAQSKPVKQAISQYFNDPWRTSPKPTGDSARGSPLLPTTKPNSTPGPSLMPSHKPGSLGSELAPVRGSAAAPPLP